MPQVEDSRSPFNFIQRLHFHPYWRRHVSKAVVRALSEGRKKAREMDPSASGREVDYVRQQRAGIEWTQMPLWHDTLSVCEAREGKPAGAGRPLVCVGRRALSKQRTRNPCRAMRSPWLGLSVGHCGIKLLRRSRDNVSTQSVCMSVRGPSLPPSGIIVSCSTRD